jgi:aspartyl/asparaginyl beta-hydroxylase (cupin superfamily)
MVYIICASLLLLLWILESRVFLVLYHHLLFSFNKREPLVVNKNIFPESKMLEDNWQIIHQEMMTVMNNNAQIPKFHEVDAANHKISFDQGPAWRTFMLKAFDGWFEKNCVAMPETTKLLQKCPSVCSALISVLEPGVIIPEHTGKLKGIYRYHLGLAIPESKNCYLKLAGSNYHWQQGKGMLFDDTFPHEVRNETHQHRVVLFLNVKREMPSPLKRIDDFFRHLILISPIFKKALKRGSLTIE